MAYLNEVKPVFEKQKKGIAAEEELAKKTVSK